MAPDDKRVVVLVVEDDPDLRQLYRDALSHIAGYAVVAVEDGIDALRYLDVASMPAAVLLDLELPRLSGRDLRMELAAHEATRNIPIVVVTGNPGEIDPSDVACVLTKPVDAESLVKSVQTCVRRAELRRQSAE